MNIFFLRLRKAIFVLFKPIFWPAALNGVFPSIEHEKCLAPLKGKVDAVIDVGANKGQFALLISDMFGPVYYIAFEPIPEIHYQLKKVVNNLPLKSQLYDVALSDVPCSDTIFHIASAADSSSLLPITSMQVDVFNVVDSGKTLLVDVKTLDDYFSAFENIKNLLIKIDVQGLELNVLKGAVKALSIAKYVLVEASSVEFYKGQSLFHELDQFMTSVGFSRYRSFANTFSSKGDVLQGDYLYVSCRYI